MDQQVFSHKFTAWANSVNGSCLDLDGFPPEQPYQCHDVWLSLITSVLGLKVADGFAPGSGYTDQVWRQFPVTEALGKKFTKHTGAAGIRRGDVLFWPYGDPNYPWSHVAAALGPVVNGQVLCLTQNPGCTNVATLPVSQLLGYLRPIVTSKPPQKRINMSTYTPSPSRVQSFDPGDYRLVVTGDGKADGSSRPVTIAMGAGAHIVYGQVNLSGRFGEEVEVAMAIDTTDGAGMRKGKPRFVGAETATLGSSVTKIGLTVPLKLKKNERVRLYVKPLGKNPVRSTFVRWSVAS